MTGPPFAMPRPKFLPRIQLHRPGADLLTFLCIVLILVQATIAYLGSPSFAKGVSAAEIAKGVEEIYVELGLTRDGILHGKVWQLLSHPFLHADWLHLALNWLVIYLVGGRVYHILGARGFAKIFFGGVLVGSALHLLFHPAKPILSDPVANGPLVGASGAAMALLLTLTSLSPHSRMWPIPVSGKNLGRGLLSAALLLFLLTPGLRIPFLSDIGNWLVALGGEGLFRIGHIYHFGGGLMGVLYARWLLRRPVTLEELQRDRARREGIAA